jgi:predicted permease
MNAWDLWLRLRALALRRRVDDELDAELELHIEMLTRKNLAAGMGEEEARRRARARFGPKALIEDQCRDARGIRFVDVLWQDVRYALRTFRRNPAFVATAVLTLALSIGANTAIFSLVDAALLKDLPVRDPDTLVALDARQGERNTAFGYPQFHDLSSRQQILSEIVASGSIEFNRVRFEGVAEDLDDVRGGVVSANYFTLLGVNAVVGRVFTPADSQVPGEGAVAVISYAFWSGRLARDPSIAGRAIHLNDTAFTIIGVTPKGFFGDRVGVARDIWILILMQPRLASRNLLDVRTATWFRPIGRLKSVRDERRAAAELTTIFQQIKSQEIATGSGSLIQRGRPEEFRIELARGSAGLNAMRRVLWRPLTILTAAVGLVLLIACFNIANLLITRGMARRREIGIRLAIGASRTRLIRQLLTESVLLAAAGGGVGLLLMRWTSDLLVRQMPLGVFDIQPDARVFTFTLAASALTALLCGLIPALHATSVEINPSLQATGLPPVAGWARQCVRQALVIGQVGLSLWLLIGAGLLIRSLQNFRDLDIGVDRVHVVTVTLRTNGPSVPPPQLRSLRATLAERLRTIPGVTSVGFAAYGLFQGSMQTAPVRVPDSPIDPERDPEVRQNAVSPEYFRTVGMTVVRGRTFTERDARSNVVVINETTARHYFGERNPLGRLIYFPRIDEQRRYIPFSRTLDNAEGREIIGVVRDAKYDNLREDARHMTYQPMPEDRGGLGLLHLRLASGTAGLTNQIQHVLNVVEPNLTVHQVTTLEDAINETLASERLVTKLLGFFGVMALLLAAVGLYGVIAYTVSRRTREIGIRMALGARRRTLVSMVLRDTVRLAVVGVALGIPAALSTTHLLNSLLFGLQPTDLPTLIGTALLLLGVSVLAGALPARRAASVDPTVALRYE